MYAERRFGRVVVSLLALCLLATALVGVAVAAGSPAQDGTIIVDEDGGGDYESIQAAVDAAEDGDTIRVRDGTYDGFGVDKNVTVTTDSAVIEGPVTISGTGSPTIEGFEMREDVTDRAGIRAMQSRGEWTVRDVTVRSPNSPAVRALATAGGWRIVDSTLSSDVDTVAASSESEAWRLEDSVITGEGRNVRGEFGVLRRNAITGAVDGRFEVESIDARRNYWGQSGGPREGQCGSGVDCSNPLDSSPVGPVALALPGETLVVGGDGEFASIQAAVDAAQSGDTIRVERGRYDGFEVGKTVKITTSGATIQGTVDISGSAAPIIEGFHFEPGTTARAINATGTSGAWTLRDITAPARNSPPRGIVVIRARESTGDWRIVDSEIGGLTAQASRGDWTLVDTTVGGPLVAADSNGDWVVSDTVFVAKRGIFEVGRYPNLVIASQTDGDWTIRRSAVVHSERAPPTTDISVAVGETSGAWRIVDSYFGPFVTAESSAGGTVRNSFFREGVGFNNGGSAATVTSSTILGEAYAFDTSTDEPVDLTGNYWGQPGGPRDGNPDGGDDIEDQCRGQVDCGRALDASPVDLPEVVLEAIPNGVDIPLPNQGPTAIVRANRPTANGTVYVRAGGSITFDGSASIDPEGSIRSYEWTVDGTAQSDSQQFQTTFGEPGRARVTLTVADGQYSDSERLAVAVLGEDEPLPDEALGGGDTIAPMADLQTPVETVPVGESLRLSAAESVDPDGAILDYRWDFDGDGSVDQTTQEPTIRHAFEQSGSYDPTVTVVDSAGATATASTTVRVAAESAFPTASFDVGAVDGDELVAGAPVGFSAADSTAPDEIVSYEWEFGDGTTRRMTARRSSSPRPETTYSYDRPGEYTVTLTVTAENGLQRRTNRTIRVGAPATPEIGSVDAEKPGQMIRGIDLENSYTVPVSSQVDIESVVFEFPGGETREATRARALERRVERVTDRSDVTLWQLADVNVDTVTGPGVNTVEVRATDEQGQTGTTTFSVGAFDPPAWFATLMGDPTVTRDEGRWVLQSDSLAVPPDELPGPTFDLDVPVEEIAGQFEVGIGANYGFEYVFAQSRATANGGGVLSLSTPIPGLSTETDIGSVLGGPSTGPVTVSGTVRVTENAQRAVFERGRVAYGVETSGTVLLAGVGVPVPKTGGTVGVTVDLTLTTGIEPAVELAVNDARTSVGLSAIDLTQSLDVNVTAGAGGSVGLGGTRVGLEIRGIAGGGVEFTTEVLPELNTERVLVELRAGARACLGPCLTEWVLNDEYPLVTEEPAAPRLEVTPT